MQLDEKALEKAAAEVRGKYHACTESTKPTPCCDRCQCYNDAKTAIQSYLTSLPSGQGELVDLKKTAGDLVFEMHKLAAAFGAIVEIENRTVEPPTGGSNG